MAMLTLKNLGDSQRLGRWLAENLEKYNFPALFLRGALGCGKTTLTRNIAALLPGAEDAAVCSPSFNIFNIYPTTPLVIHCDLYRCHGNLPEELLEAMENGNTLLIVEWAEYFPASERPLETLDINFNLDNDNRLLNLAASGVNSRRLMHALLDYWI